MKNNNFYVYEHWRPDRGECFYVGKGRGKRANILVGRNLHHMAIQAKLGRLGLCVEIRLVKSGLMEDEAFALECERIAFWRADGADLANMTDGGEGASGRMLSDESRKKISLSNKGRVLSAEIKAKIALASAGRPCSKETREKIGTANRGKKGRTPSAEQIMALVESNKRRRGIHFSDEHRAKLSKSRRRRVVTDETKEKISATLRGRTLSPEHRAKIKSAHMRKFSI
jgi:NUMOD3 motif